MAEGVDASSIQSAGQRGFILPSSGSLPLIAKTLGHVVNPRKDLFDQGSATFWRERARQLCSVLKERERTLFSGLGNPTNHS